MGAGERILIVGAGAVGQAYGYHLSQGGAQVTYLVKEKHAEAAGAGFTLHRLRMFRRPKTLRFEDADLLVDYDAVGEREWDQVWLCVSSTALRGGWLEDLTDQIGDATLVALQPGVDDAEYIGQFVPGRQIVSGMITLIGYQAPLPGERLAPGVAYFLPPMTPISFAGEPGRVEPVVEALERGGCSAKIDHDVAAESAFASALLIPAVAALELAGWSLARYRKSFALELSTRAAREALDALAVRHDRKPSLGLRLARRPELFGTGMRLAPHLMPFDLQEYLRFHFTKTADQTRQMIDDYIALGDQYARPNPALRMLRERLATDL